MNETLQQIEREEPGERNGEQRHAMPSERGGPAKTSTKSRPNPQNFAPPGATIHTSWSHLPSVIGRKKTRVALKQTSTAYCSHYASSSTASSSDEVLHNPGTRSWDALNKTYARLNTPHPPLSTKSLNIRQPRIQASCFANCLQTSSINNVRSAG